MSKWIVVSDNHSETGILYDIYQHHADADAFFHLGDSEFKYDDTELSLYHRVKGNMDFYPEFPEAGMETYDGVKIFYTHGHLYGVNGSRNMLAEQALQNGAQFALYGHTHVARYENINGLHVINPGSISQSRSPIEETYAEIIEENKKYNLNFLNRQHQIIESIKFE